MKFIKMTANEVHIKTDDSDEFEDLRINDLLSVSDGSITLVAVVSAITNNCDMYSPYDEGYMGDEYEETKTIECSLIGSIINGRFTKAIDKYPTSRIDTKMIRDKEFSDMLGEGEYGAQALIPLGKYANYECPAYIDGNKFYQRHSCIVGNTGSGKSETVAKIMEETTKNTNCNIILFDIHGEYSDLPYVDALRIGEEISFPVWMFGLSDFMSNILKLKGETATVAASAIRKGYYKQTGRGNEDKPVYFDYAEMLHYLIEKNEEVVSTGERYKTGDKAGMEKTIKGDYNGKLSGVINTMQNFTRDSRYSFLFNNEKQEYLTKFVNRVMGGENKVKSLDLSGVPHDIAVFIIGAVAKMIFNVQVACRNKSIKPITLICDEAHIYIPTNFQLSASQARMVEIFENIAKEGRKFGITLITASQRPSELNKTIMAQCANYIVMKLNNENDKSMMKGILTEGNGPLIDSTSMFSPGEALVVGDAAPIISKIKVGLAKDRPKSRTIDFWDEWKSGELDFDYSRNVEEYMRDLD